MTTPTTNLEDADPLERVLDTLSVAFHYGLAHGIQPHELDDLCAIVLEDVKRQHGFAPTEEPTTMGAVH